TPLLVLLFHFHPGTAVGTDLLYASATKSVGTAVHGANRTIDWRITGRMGLGSVPATLAMVLLLYVLHLHGDAASKLISTVLGVALFLTAATLLFRRQIFAFAERHAAELSPRTTTLLTIGLGALLGAMITLSSVGAGAIGVTVLIFLYPKMPVAQIVGSDIAHAVPLTLIAGAGHWFLGSVNVPLLCSLLVGSIPGIVIGSHLTARIPEGVLRPILAGTLFLVATKLVF
ncbi:MAG: sulfite exporter TauE/SafE family protein, partial [Caulobacteraceae bacterium]|nr:sulfite exporter TauE/SafE family protein [Caulobacteraceae bacterium]